jgi:hypothetical protein
MIETAAHNIFPFIAPPLVHLYRAQLRPVSLHCALDAIPTARLIACLDLPGNSPPRGEPVALSLVVAPPWCCPCRAWWSWLTLTALPMWCAPPS